MSAADPPPILIRPVRPADEAAWRTLWAAYNAFYGRRGETALLEAVTRLTWSRFFDGYEPLEAMVAERAGGLVGLAHLLFHRSTILAGPACYLQDLFTAPECRGQGVGRALIEAAYERARAAGAARVYWQTHETNAQAMRLYDGVATRSGFVVYRKDL